MKKKIITLLNLTVLLVVTTSLIVFAKPSNIIEDNLITFYVPYDDSNLRKPDIAAYEFTYSSYSKIGDVDYEITENDSQNRWEIVATGISQNRLPALFYINTEKNLHTYNMQEGDVGKTVDFSTNASQEGRINLQYEGAALTSEAEITIFGYDHNNSVFEIGDLDNQSTLPAGKYAFLVANHDGNQKFIDFIENVTITGQQTKTINISRSELTKVNLNIDNTMVTDNMTGIQVELNLDYSTYGSSIRSKLFIETPQSSVEFYAPDLLYDSLVTELKYTSNMGYTQLTYVSEDIDFTGPTANFNFGHTFTLDFVENAYYVGQMTDIEDFIRLHDEYNNTVSPGRYSTSIKHMNLTLNGTTTSIDTNNYSSITLPLVPGTYTIDYTMDEKMMWPYTNNAQTLRLKPYDKTGKIQFRIYTDNTHIGKYDLTLYGKDKDSSRYRSTSSFDYEPVNSIINNPQEGYYDIMINNLDFNQYPSFYLSIEDDNKLFFQEFTASNQSKQQHSEDLVPYTIVDSNTNPLSKFSYTIYLQGDAASKSDPKIGDLYRIKSDKIYLPENNYIFYIHNQLKDERLTNSIFITDANENRTITLANKNLCEVIVNTPTDFKFDRGTVYAKKERINHHYHSTFYSNFRTNKIITDDNSDILHLELRLDDYYYRYDRHFNPNEFNGNPITINIGRHLTGTITKNNFDLSTNTTLNDTFQLTDEYQSDMELQSYNNPPYEVTWLKGNTIVSKDTYKYLWKTINVPTTPGTYTLNIKVNAGKLGIINTSQQVLVTGEAPSYDLNNDGVIDTNDLVLLKTNYGNTDNNNHLIDIIDITTLSNNINN